jgi:cation:H+ antiporter
MAQIAYESLLFVLGLTALTLGAEGLVRGAARLALIMGVPPIAVGLTIVAFGTSMPELVVSTQAALQDRADLAVGNAVGSNTFNVLFILGITAVIAPIACNVAFISREVPIMIAVAVLFPLLAAAGLITHGAHDGVLLTAERWTGWLMVALLLLYTYLTYRRGLVSKEPLDADLEEIAKEESKPHGVGHLATQIAFVVGGLVLLVIGAQILVASSIRMAQAVGISELVISLTLVAAGTSLPELATSLVAALRGQSEISIGNIVGSNIFNILGVLGISAMVRSLPLNDLVVYRDIPVMIAISILCLPVMMTGRRISRAEGLLFLGLYVAYTIALIQMGG